MRKVRSAAIVLGTVTALAAGGASVAAPAVGSTHTSPSWHIALSVGGPNFPTFSAGTAVSATSAWAFEFAQAANAKPVAYQLSGHTWKQKPFPGTRGAPVVSASASSSTNVWAFEANPVTGGGSALHFNGHSWRSVKTFRKVLTSGLALSSTDVWVFGQAFAPELGNMHYNGHRWKDTGGPALQGASALSAKSIWGYGINKVAHWNGSKWTATSLAKLLPKGGGACSPGVLDGIFASSATSVYAIALGGCPDGQGPFVLLHYNGKRWRVLAPANNLTIDPTFVISDGSGGVWIPSASGAPSFALMEHYAHGTLRNAKLPGKNFNFSGASTGKRTTAAFVFGAENNKAINPTKSSAVILEFES